MQLIAFPNFYRFISDIKKNAMHRTPAKLAAQYKVRQQRIIAIIALKQMEKRAEAEGKPVEHAREQRVEAITGVVDVGTGERHVVENRPDPSYEVVHDGLPDERRPEQAPPHR